MKIMYFMRRRIVGLLLFIFLIGSVISINSETNRLLGDVNNDGQVNIVDALLIALFCVGSGQIDISIGDVNYDGQVTIIDALRVAQYSVGMVTFAPQPTPTMTGVTPVPTHYGNPFIDAKWYVNPDWSSKAISGGGAKIANCNTAIWLDSSAAITEGRGLRGHLDTALTQDADLIVIVLYNSPYRSCASLLNTEEIVIDNHILSRYKTDFVDPIYSILKDPRYSQLRIITIIEPDSLPNLITNLFNSICKEAEQSGAVVYGIQYVLNQFNTLPNVYCYLDIAYSAWLGWPDNFKAAVDLYYNVIKNTINGVNCLDGFSSNTAMYIPFEEPFLPDPNLKIGGQMLYSSRFYEYNRIFDEKSYCISFYNAMIAKGLPATIGMLVDTSRNGWGGPSRPTTVSQSTDVNTYVDESCIDRRFHRGNWCNQIEAGLGMRPVASPLPFFDAFVWVKPPGESDGISQAGIIDPNHPEKYFDVMCDPNGKNTYCNCGTTGAMPAPHFGQWNQPQFEMLLKNAYPPLE